MPRPIASVYVDIARFVLEVSRISGDSADSTERLRGIWLTELMESLGMRDPSMHAYGAYLLQEAETYATEQSEKKRAAAQSRWGNQDKNAPASNGMHVHPPACTCTDCNANDATDRSDSTDRADLKILPVQGVRSSARGSNRTRAGGDR